MGSKEGDDLARRLREVRIQHEGQTGQPSLAGELGLPPRTWMNYEAGVAIPGLQLLRLIARTGVHPIWLLTGGGNRYLEPAPEFDASRQTSGETPHPSDEVAQPS